MSRCIESNIKKGAIIIIIIMYVQLSVSMGSKSQIALALKYFDDFFASLAKRKLIGVEISRSHNRKAQMKSIHMNL